MKTSKLNIYKNVKTFGPVPCPSYDKNAKISAQVRYDDRCGNGHNTFAITGEISRWGRIECCGCCHEEIAKAFPELAPFIKWHLFDSTGPMYYTPNALYWAGHCGYRDGKPNSPPNVEHFKSTIVFGSVPGDESFDFLSLFYSDAYCWTHNDCNKVKISDWLEIRKEKLLEAFISDVEKLGFEF